MPNSKTPRTDTKLAELALQSLLQKRYLLLVEFTKQMEQIAEKLAGRIRLVNGHDLTCSYDSLSSDPATDFCNCGKVTYAILEDFNKLKDQQQ